MRKIAVFLMCLLASGAAAKAEAPRVFAITGARVIEAPGRAVDGATIVLRDGLVESVGRTAAVPAGAFVIDAAGKTVTAGFIDACTDLGQKKVDAMAQAGAPGAPPGGGPPQGPPREPPPGPLHPVSRIRPERKAVDMLVTDAAAFEKHRAMGFTSAVTMPGEGIFRGEAALIDLGAGAPSGNIVKASAGQMIAFERGGFGQGYPTSLMGAIAAIRQALLDAQRQAVWSARYEADPVGMPRPDYLEAFAPLQQVVSGRAPAIFDIRDGADIVRALDIAAEFSLKAILVGSGAEAVEPGAIGALKKTGVPVILPLAFPDKPKVDDPDEALNVTLQDLETWDAAPGNAGKLSAAGVPIALGTCRLAAVGEFPANLRKAIAAGLTADAALAALTTAPAKLFGVEKTLGTIEPGRIANLVVFDGAPAGGEGVFAESSKPTQVFVDGVKYDIEQRKSKGDPSAKVDPRGTWSVVFAFGGRTVNRAWTIAGKAGDYSGTAETQTGVVEFVSVKLMGNEMTVVLPAQGGRPVQEVVVVIVGDSFEGSGSGGSASYTVKGTRTAGPDGGAL